MGFLSKLIPNELKHGGWLDYAGAAVGAFTGNPLLGAAIGGGAAAYRGKNPLVGAGTGFLSGSLFSAASGAPGAPGLAGAASEGGGISDWLKNLFTNAQGPVAEGVEDAAGVGIMGGENVAAGNIPASATSTFTQPSLMEQLFGKAQGGGAPGPGGGKLGMATTGLNLASGAYGLYNAAQTRKLAAPGRAAAGALNNLTNNPAAIRSIPGYQAGKDAMQQQLERELAKQGQTGGGMAAEAMARAGGAYDTQFRMAEMQRLQATAQGAVPAETQANDIVRRALEQISYTFRRA